MSSLARAGHSHQHDSHRVETRPRCTVSIMPGGERGEHLVADMPDGALAVDIDVVRGALVAAFGPLHVMGDKGFRLRVIVGDAALDGLLVVIGPLYQGLAGHVVLVRRPRG